MTEPFDQSSNTDHRIRRGITQVIKRDLVLNTRALDIDHDGLGRNTLRYDTVLDDRGVQFWSPYRHLVHFGGKNNMVQWKARHFVRGREARLRATDSTPSSVPSAALEIALCLLRPKLEHVTVMHSQFLRNSVILRK
jgi:hypothetical protein